MKTYNHPPARIMEKMFVDPGVVIYSIPSFAFGLADFKLETRPVKIVRHGVRRTKRVVFMPSLANPYSHPMRAVVSATDSTPSWIQYVFTRREKQRARLAIKTNKAKHRSDQKEYLTHLRRLATERDMIFVRPKSSTAIVSLMQEQEIELFPFVLTNLDIFNDMRKSAPSDYLFRIAKKLSPATLISPDKDSETLFALRFGEFERVYP